MPPPTGIVFSDRTSVRPSVRPLTVHLFRVTLHCCSQWMDVTSVTSMPQIFIM